MKFPPSIRSPHAHSLTDLALAVALPCTSTLLLMSRRNPIDLTLDEDNLSQVKTKPKMGPIVGWLVGFWLVGLVGWTGWLKVQGGFASAWNQIGPGFGLVGKFETAVQKVWAKFQTWGQED
ncbi:MAG: hypothetical protein P4L81_00445 [Candidatus Pacebacteria bacterium]|nr:hypothetical protein [Candidatus Paceibacterota bacterium]